MNKHIIFFIVREGRPGIRGTGNNKRKRSNDRSAYGTNYGAEGKL